MATPVTLVNQAGAYVGGGAGAASNQVQGNSASGASDVGNPLKVAGVFNTATPTFTNGQRGDVQVTAKGSLRTLMTGTITAGADGQANSLVFPGREDAAVETTLGYGLGVYGFVYNGATWDRQRGDVNGAVVQPALSSSYWQYAAVAGGIVSSTADVVLKAAAGAGVRNYLHSLQIAHDTLSAATEFVIKDGATVVHRGKLQTAAIDSAAGSGSLAFDPPIRGSANTALNFALISSVTGGVFVNAQGHST